MIREDLQEKWQALELMPREGDYDQLLVSTECLADLWIAISPECDRCLILRLPANFKLEFKPVTREKLSLGLVTDKNYVAINLHDTEFVDLFDDLIVSVHNAVRDIKNVDASSSIFIKTFHKWVKFFDAGYDGRLSEQAVIGLFGEMTQLKVLISDSAAKDINQILEGWRGPYDQGHDFVYEDRDIEVKTRGEGSAGVKVSNEDQLDQKEAKGLELAVVIIDKNNEAGAPLSDLVSEVVGLIEDRLGDTSILYTALLQKNIGPHNIGEYDDIKLRAVEIYMYDCLAMGFPKIARSQIEDALYLVRYSLDTDQLADYLVDQVDLR